MTGSIVTGSIVTGRAGPAAPAADRLAVPPGGPLEPAAAGLDAALRRLGEVGLAELLVADELLTRSDRKYLVDASVLPELVERLPSSIRALEIDGARTFRYESMYFDTPDLVTYAEAARLRPGRFKVRTRAYLDSEMCSLEVKTRDARGLTVKQRIDHEIGHRDRLTSTSRAFVAGIPDAAPHADRLEPTVWTRYRRSTLLLSADSRATLDVGLRFETPDGRDADGGPWAIVESKSMGKPTVVDRALWAMGHRPLPLSKYAVAMASLHPQLPAHRWNRPLRAAWGWEPAGHPLPPVPRRQPATQGFVLEEHR